MTSLLDAYTVLVLGEEPEEETPAFRTIVADPPWRYQKTKGLTTRGHIASTAEAHYPTMSMRELAELPIGELAAEDAHLYLWVTNPILTEQRRGDGPNAFGIARAWGFEPRTLLTWHKQGTLGMGWYFRGETEHVIFATRGDAKIPVERRERNWFAAPKVGHSIKPDCFLDLVERVSPAPRLELFARRARLGWDYWGDEALSTVELAA